MSDTNKWLAFSVCLLMMSCSSHRESSQKAASSPAASAQNSPIVERLSESGDGPTDDFIGRLTAEEKPKSNQPPSVLKEVRTGDHKKFDRIVFEFSSALVPGYKVEYADKPAVSCGSGKAVEVVGQAVLVVQLKPAQAHDDQGKATISERDLTPTLPILKQAKLSCDFEADVEWALGLGEKRPYRVLELNNPARLVVDIKH
jgi:hypothetical protein